MKILRAEQIKEKIIYIAGPITGVPDYKTPFDAARRIFQHAGKDICFPRETFHCITLLVLDCRILV